MAGFENYGADTVEIELEIERKGIVLGVDWSDEVQVRALAREALNHLHLPTPAIRISPRLVTYGFYI